MWYLGRSVLYGDLAAPCLPGSCTDTGNKVTEGCFFAGRFSAAPMSTSAVCLQKLCLELYSGITVKFPLIWAEGSISCIVFSGDLQLLSG